MRHSGAHLREPRRRVCLHHALFFAGSGHFQRALGRVLAAHISKIECEMLQLAEHLRGFHFEGGRVNASVARLVDQVANLEQGFNGIDIDALDHRGTDQERQRQRGQRHHEGECGLAQRYAADAGEAFNSFQLSIDRLIRSGLMPSVSAL